VEALVNLLLTVGKELDASPRSAHLMEKYFAQLDYLSKSKTLVARLRFACRDLLDMRKNSWVPRREKLTAKRLDEVRAEAAVALGLKQPEESLFPEGPNGPQEEDGWSVAGKKNKHKAEEGPGYSALTGQYVPPPTPRAVSDRPRPSQPKAAAPKAEAAEQPAAPAATAAPRGKAAPKLTAEEVDEQVLKLCAEFQVAADLKDALLCVKDIQSRAPSADAATLAVCSLAVKLVMDESSERAAEAMAKLLAHLAKEGAVSAAALKAGLASQLEQLDDLAIDVPMAPKLAGSLLAALIACSALPAAFFSEACTMVGDMLCRRDLAVAVLQQLAAAAGFDFAAFVSVASLKSVLVDDLEDEASLVALFAKRGLQVKLE
jgi:translation initiation factor 4G